MVEMALVGMSAFVAIVLAIMYVVPKNCGCNNLHIVTTRFDGGAVEK